MKAFYKLIYNRHIVWGKRTTFRRRFSLFISNEGFVRIGNNCFFNNDCSINCLKEITVGNDCIFGEGVKIYDHNHGHKISDIPFGKQEYSCERIKIGNNCWFGSNAVILKGVEIGDNVVIGAGCVIYKNVESGSVIVSDHFRIK